jgi:hypothetical protein
MEIEWSEERGPDADAPDFHRVGIREDGLKIIAPIWHGPRTFEEIRTGQEVYFREKER